jgi:hypothetical protein
LATLLQRATNDLKEDTPDGRWFSVAWHYPEFNAVANV